MAYPTNPIYKLLKTSPDHNNVNGVETMQGDIRKVIPFANDNTDYQTYLEWAKTNTAEAAD
tara:strand:- start:46 stop:228 length:183 start_codon:yes stop_codon:yes gene_type:complete